MGYFLLFLGCLLITRTIEFWAFLRKVNAVCNDYNWQHIERNPTTFIEAMETDDYKFHCNWSAYKFMFLAGPHPVKIFFTLKRLTLENIYGKDNVAKLKEYEVI